MWLTPRLIRRCIKSAERFVDAAFAAPLPLRLSAAGVAALAATAAEAALPPTLAHALPYAAYYLPVGLSLLFGGLPSGAFAAFASVLLSHAFVAPLESPADRIGAALFLANCGFLAIVTEAFHRVRQRVSRALPRSGGVSRQLASVALAAPGVVGAFYVDANGRVAYRYVSPKSKTVFGLDPDAICADAGVFFKRLSRDDLEKLNAGLYRSACDLSLWVVEFRFDHPEKGNVWIEAQAAPAREADGLIVWHGYASDITERKRAELALAESAERLQATIEAAQDAVLTMDAAGRICSVNRAGIAMFGYGADEIARVNVAELTECGDAEPVTAADAGGRREITGRRKSGKVFPAEISLSEMKFERELLVAFIKDLTEQRKIQEHLEELHRNRLDAMGGMAAALAHEINQPLAANATYLRVARRLLDKFPHGADPALTEVLDKAAVQTLRAGRIVTSLRDLVRRGEPDKTLVSVNEIIREAYDSAAAEDANAPIRIELRPQATCDQVLADRIQLRQVLANLIRNATEAMQCEERRELIISTTNPGDNTIRVDVIDSGCGLPESCGVGYFEPFTTTKAKGMGVGLSISRSIVEAHYGRIWATPNAGGGAVFSFALPLQDSDVDA